MTKRLMIIVALVGLVFLVACGKKDDVEPEAPVDNGQTNESSKEKESDTNDQGNKNSEKDVSKSEEASNSTSPDNSADENDKSDEPENDEQETEITMTGSYNGQADPHTIEVETNEGPVAYQLTMEARDMVVDLKPGDEVQYMYYEDGEMLVINHIQKVN